MGEVVGAIVILAIVVFLVAIWWFLFEKAGEDGWKAIVPIYNEFILAKIAVNAKFAWIYLVVCLFSAFVPFVGIAALFYTAIFVFALASILVRIWALKSLLAYLLLISFASLIWLLMELVFIKKIKSK